MSIDLKIEGSDLMTGQHRTLSYHDYVQGFQMLTPEEQLSLIEVILTNVNMMNERFHILGKTAE